MTTDLPLSANWLLNVYVNDVNAIRFDDERLRAIDAAIDEHNVAIEALKAERGTLRAAQEERIEARNRALCTALHVKLDEDGCPVRRQGPPKKDRAAEPPALVSPTPDLTNPNVIGAMAALVPTPDPILANLVNDAARGLAAQNGGAPTDTAPETPAPAGEAPTAADAFIDAVSEPERSLYEQGFSRAEVAATPIAEQWRLKRENVGRGDVHQIDGGLWIEPGAAASVAGEDCPL